MAVLGHALATDAGTTYPLLLTDRILHHLGMDDTEVVTERPPAGALPGHRANGTPADPWIGPGYAPDGVGMYSTAADLATLMRAVVAGRRPAPGRVRRRPPPVPMRGRAVGRGRDDRRVGLAWFTTRFGGDDVRDGDAREITWHNGATGGFSAFVGYDRQSGRAVVVLGNSETAVDPIALRLLGVTPDAEAGRSWRHSPRSSCWSWASRRSRRCCGRARPRTG